MIDIKKPKATMFLITYQQEQVVSQAVLGAINQTYSPLQIIISDDASTDETFSKIKRTIEHYRGPHEILLRKNEKNLGISSHFSKLIDLADGDLLFVTAGDDVSEITRCEKVVRHWMDNGCCHDLIATDLLDIDDCGMPHGIIKHSTLDNLSLDDWLEKSPWIVGASHTWTKRLFNRFGKIGHGINSEDQIMLLRALLSGGATTLHEPLVRWRRGGLSRKRRNPTLKAMLEHLKRGNISTRAELKQILADAELAGQFDRVRIALQSRIDREDFLMRILGAATLKEKFLVTLYCKTVPISYRMRIFGYTNFSWVYDPIIRLKYMAKLTSRKDAAGRPAEN